MKKSNPGMLEKLFSNIGLGSSRVPLKSNLFHYGSKGYQQIGATGRSSYNPDRQSPLLGNSTPSNRLSGYYDRVHELHGYQLLDIVQLCVGFFKDYLVNYMTKSETKIVSILNEEGNNNEQVSERLNNALVNQLDIVGFIKSHLDDVVYYGTYGSFLKTGVDDTGHTSFSFLELYDPVSTVIKRRRNKEGETEELCLARGDDGSLYEIPEGEYFVLGSPNLRLVNDLGDDWKDKGGTVSYSQKDQNKDTNRDKVIRKESYLAGEPLFYSLIIKVKELVIKELLVSLLSLRDLATPSLLAICVDKGVSLEAAQDLCARMQKLTTNYAELSSFISSTFDATSFIENILSQNIKFFPDYNGTLTNKSSLNIDKLGSEKLMEIIQLLDSNRGNLLNSIGLPTSLLDGTSMGKWSVLQSSDRAQNRVTSFISGIQESIVNLVLAVYKKLYNEDLDPSLVKLHIFEKSSVEFNAQINQAESVSSIVNSISGLLQTVTQTMDGTIGLIEPEKMLNYIQNLIKDIDPSAAEIITKETIQQYVELYNMKLQMQKEQLGAGGEMM